MLQNNTEAQINMQVLPVDKRKSNKGMEYNNEKPVQHFFVEALLWGTAYNFSCH